MKFVKLAVVTLAFAACAHGKMGKVEKALETGAVSKTTPIYVEKINAADARFTGDKADDVATRDKEKTTIESAYYSRIVDALRAKGYNASVTDKPVTNGVVLSGKVLTVGHGSGAARFFVGMGAGQANLTTEFTIEDRTAKKTLGKFEIIATSGGESRGGSYLDRHLDDGSKKVAEYIAGEKKE
jgi:hypothetical protein